VLNLQIARAYLAGTDNRLATRTWQNAIEALTNSKQGANGHRWRTAARDMPSPPQKNSAVSSGSPTAADSSSNHLYSLVLDEFPGAEG
jgi:hypothetical protein